MKNVVSKACFVFFLGILLSIVQGTLEVVSSAPITLRFSTHMPARDPIVISMVEGLDRIEKKAGGAVKFEKFFDGTLIGVKDSWEELIKGTADIVNISAHNSPGAKVLPLHMMLGNAWIGVKDLRTQLKIQKQLLREFPELAKEWSAVKILSFQGISDINLHSKRKIQALSDVKGMQIRGIGSWPKATLEKLGASLVAMPITEVYIALQKGIIDGILLDNSALLTYRFTEVVPYTILIGGVFPGVNNLMCMNLNTWKKLPLNVQKIFEETEEWINERYIQLREERMKEAMDFAREKKHQFLTLPKEELAKLHDLLREEAFEEAKKLDAKGLPGIKVMQRLYELIRQTK